MRDVADFIYSHFQDVRMTSNGSDYMVDCPFCEERIGKEDWKKHLRIAVNKEVCHCFRCEYKATWVQLVMDVLHVPYARALGELYVTPKPIIDCISFTDEQPRRRVKSDARALQLPEGCIPLYTHDAHALQAIRVARKYLLARGFDRWYWTRYNLGYMGARIIIPIEGTYWQGRAIYPFMEPKYMAPEELSLDLLFNSSALDMYDEIVVTEGAFSAMAVGENAVALVGKNPTTQKVARMVASQASRFIITVETKAEPQMTKLADALLAAGKYVTIWKYANDTDPADWIQPIASTYDFKTKVELLLYS